MISIVREGNNLVNFIDISVTRGLDNVTGWFSLTTTLDENSQFPIRMGEQVTLFADGIKILTAFVEKIDVNYSKNQHSISMSGRGILCDFVDSTVNKKTLEFDKRISLKKIIELLFSSMGIKSSVIDNTNETIDDFSSTELTSSAITETGFQFIEPFARKRQVILSTDEDGNLVMQKNLNEKLDLEIINLKNNRSNNVISGNMNLDHTKVFNNYLVKSQLNLVNLSKDTPLSQVVNQVSKIAKNKQVRDTRSMVLFAEESSDVKTLNSRVSWEANIRRIQSLNYNVKLQGHSENETIFTPGKIVNVKDIFAGIDGEMLIKTVTWSGSIAAGSKTDLVLTYQDAYSLQEQEKPDKKILQWLD